MRLSLSLSLSILLLVTVIAGAVQRKGYLTEEELDLVRDAQDVHQRVPLYLKLAEKRLVTLGLLESKEKPKKKKKDDKKSKDESTKIEDDSYLLDFTRAELLRGYLQAIDEAMSNIEDAYERKFDVRKSLEDLEKFTRETLPLLEHYEPKDEAEKPTLVDSITKAKAAMDGAKDALEIVPKTEKKTEKKK